MEKLAEGLQKLGEDDLLHVVTMVHDNKTAETYTKNDVESRCRYSIVLLYTNHNSDGEFHVDLYTLPDSLVKMLWEFTASKTDI
jgi:transcription initiation factor TFIID/TFIIF subunit